MATAPAFVSAATTAVDRSSGGEKGSRLRPSTLTDGTGLRAVLDTVEEPLQDHGLHLENTKKNRNGFRQWELELSRNFQTNKQ